MKTPYPFLILAAFTLLFLPSCSKTYVGTSIFQFQYEKPTEARQLLQDLLQPQSTSVDLKPIRNTDLFQIVVSDPDPRKAADAANAIVAELQGKIKSTYPEAKFVIWERAEPMIKK